MPRKSDPAREPVHALPTPIAVNVRLPADLHARLVRLAAQEYRSLNRQLIVLIQEALDARERQKPAREGTEAE